MRTTNLGPAAARGCIRVTIASLWFALWLAVPLCDASAQRVPQLHWAKSAAVSTAITGETQATAQTDSVRRPSGWHRFGTRAGLAGLGAVGGALVGVGVGALVCVPATCEGSAELALASGLGAVIGSAAAAALPRLGGRCSYTRRLLLTTLGAASGAALGAALAPDDAWVLIPVTTVSGAGIAALAC